MKKMRMKVLALCFSMTLTVSALAGNGRLTIQAAISQESSGTKETTEKDSTTSADTAENKNQIDRIHIGNSADLLIQHAGNLFCFPDSCLQACDINVVIDMGMTGCKMSRNCMNRNHIALF